MVKNLPVMQETQVQFLGQEDTLEEEMATHCETLAWEIPWTEEPGELKSMGSKELGMTEHVCTHTHRNSLVFLILASTPKPQPG